MHYVYVSSNINISNYAQSNSYVYMSSNTKISKYAQSNRRVN